MLFSIVRSFFSESVRDNILFHSGDLSTLREQIGGNLLPSDLGGDGTLGSLDNKDNVTELRKMEEFFQTMGQFGYI